jgi:hypothetical protein
LSIWSAQRRAASEPSGVSRPSPPRATALSLSSPHPRTQPPPPPPPPPLPPTHPPPHQVRYKVTIATSNVLGAGTDAPVLVQVVGPLGLLGRGAIHLENGTRRVRGG